MNLVIQIHSTNAIINPIHTIIILDMSENLDNASIDNRIITNTIAEIISCFRKYVADIKVNIKNGKNNKILYIIYYK